MGSRGNIFLACWGFAFMASSTASASVVEHSLIVKNLTVKKLCKQQVITAVNASLPGPLIRVNEGDTLIIHVINQSPHNVTLHWHGIFQKLSAWADGPEYVTQCPIQPGKNYTYRFNITDQEGTLWWHAHSKWLRATLYGALIVLPKNATSYPFPTPRDEFSIILGEWWNSNLTDIMNQALSSGGLPNISNAFTINGQPGDLYPCSNSTRFNVIQGNTYLLRIVNAALNNQLFFKVANHNMTVVAIDATYTTPYNTTVVVLGPGQTVDALLSANQSKGGSYYMAARAYDSTNGALSFNNSTTTAILTYVNSTSSSTPISPVLPAFSDTPTAHKFYTSLTGLTSARFWEAPIQKVDENMFMTIGLGLVSCGKSATCAGLFNQRLAASISNFSFILPTQRSMLEAHFYNLTGVYGVGFPDTPLTSFNYTDRQNSFNQSLLMTSKSTRVKMVKFNSTAEIVFQNTVLIAIENHPMHIHGFNFHVLAQGFGNYDPKVDRQKFNLINPQIRNTIAVPTGGWAVIRIRFNNPGVWMLHCHLDLHFTLGLASVFVVQNGDTPSSTLPPPPKDLPKC